MVIVRNQGEFQNAIASLEPEIVVDNNFSLTTPTNIGYAVTIKGNPGVSLFWASPTSAQRKMLIVTATGDLVIESLTLDAEGRNGTLVWVNGGKFTMNAGTVLKNIYSRESQNAVRVGDLVAPVGGTFIMNGGLITGVDSSDAVFCGGGTVVMNNDATIDSNMSAGLTMTDTMEGRVRCSLTMAGHSRISNNQSRQGASAGIIMGTDIVMGVNEGDAPIVTGNHSPVYTIGGWLLSQDVTLIMRYGAEISDNYSVGYGGGLVATGNTVITMRDNAAIKNNKSDNIGAGLILLANSKLTMEDRAEISGNVCAGRSGGLELQSRSVLEMKGSSSIYGNKATSGAGIYLNINTTATIGSDNSSPEIYDNEAENQGGGIFISTGGRLDLMGQTNIESNMAVEGNGIYKKGILNLSESPRILDGLFFDDLLADGFASSPLPQSGGAASTAKFKVELDSPDHILIEPLVIEDVPETNAVQKEAVQPSAALQSAYTGNVPVIVDTLTDNAHIKLESSDYVSPPNVPLVIADKGENYAHLGETDRAAWQIPQSFGAGYAVILNAALDQVLIDYKTFCITYEDLFGAKNPNPDSYTISDLPIILKDPGQRPGYAFAGWYDQNGHRVTEISKGTTGDLTLTAVWEELFLSFKGNASCVCNIPKAIPVGPDGKVRIPSIVPCRPCHRFLCWNMPDSGSGKAYYPCDIIPVEGSSITLCAQWQPDCCRCRDASDRPR